MKKVAGAAFEAVMRETDYAVASAVAVSEVPTVAGVPRAILGAP